MRNLILENDCEQDIPEELNWVLEKKFKEGREYWTQFKTAFYPENRQETIDKFLALKPEDNVICQTVFNGWLQLELVIDLLFLLKEKDVRINFYILTYPSLEEKLNEYLEAYESEIAPNTEKFNENPKLRRVFKEKMDGRLKESLEYHNVYDIDYDENDFKRLILQQNG